MTFPTPQMTTVDPQLAFDFTPPPPVDDDVEIKDFTVKKKRVRFKIDNDIFEATAVLGIATMQKLMTVAKDLNSIVERQDFTPLTRLFDELLLESSAARFKERLQAKGDDAIDVKQQLLPIIQYLMERFGLRPTQPSSDSSAGSSSETGGTSSTAGSSSEVSASTN